MKKKEKEEHITDLLHREIRLITQRHFEDREFAIRMSLMSLKLASNLAFDLLESAYVDCKKLDELSFHFWMVKTSLECLDGRKKG